VVKNVPVSVKASQSVRRIKDDGRKWKLSIGYWIYFYERRKRATDPCGAWNLDG
jgi:hypothetical protein